MAAERAVAPRPLWSRLGPLAPLAVRTALGCALAGYVSLALGADRPYWALVTAASLYQANLTLTWSRAVQRVVGNLVGVLLFAAVTPVARLGPLALVLCILACNFGAEALIGRNYWLGSVCVTPLALLVTELPGYQPTGELVTDRVVDTLVGALVGFAAALAVTDRRAGRRVERALTAVDRARERAARLAAGPRPRPPPWRPPAADSPPPSSTCARRPTPRPENGGSARCPRNGWCSPSRRHTVRSRRRYDARVSSRTPAPPARRRTRRTHRHDGDPRAIGRRRCHRHAGHLEHRGHVRPWARHRRRGRPAVAGGPPRPRHRPHGDHRPHQPLRGALPAGRGRPLRRAGLTRPEFDLLGALRRTGHELTPSELARETFSSGAAVTKRLKQLTERGLVERRGDTRDRRVAHVRLTDAGREAVDGILPSQLAYENAVLSGLGPAELGDLAGLLGGLLAQLEGRLSAVRV